MKLVLAYLLGRAFLVMGFSRKISLSSEFQMKHLLTFYRNLRVYLELKEKIRKDRKIKEIYPPLYGLERQRGENGGNFKLCK